MLQANELRKDNWVNAKQSGQPGVKPYQIVAIEQTTVKLANYYLLPEESISDCEYIDLEPIPVTSELLIKNCGFKKQRSSDKVVDLYFYGENPITSDFMITLKWVIGHEFPFYRNRRFEIKTLHQLQNLYLDLTGEELIVKL